MTSDPDQTQAERDAEVASRAEGMHDHGSCPSPEEIVRRAAAIRKANEADPDKMLRSDHCRKARDTRRRQKARSEG